MTPPATLSHGQQLELRALTEKVVAMFGQEITAAVHFEAKFTPRGAFPIELNLRLGGAETYKMVKAVYKVSYSPSVSVFAVLSLLSWLITLLTGSVQVDLIVEALKMQLGVQLRPEDYPDPISSPPAVFGSSVNIVPTWTGLGRLDVLYKDDDLSADAHCPALEIYFKQGDPIKCAPAGNHYLGWLVAIGDSREDAEAHLARLCSKIHYTIVPPPQ